MARRVDDNQGQIVSALRASGASVQILSALGRGCPDILVGIFGKNFLMEIKDGKKPLSGQKLTPCEIAFHTSWKGQVVIVRSVQDAINIINQAQKE